MDKVKSFEIDHLALERGVYVSRVDDVSGGGKITTFDLRMKKPYADTPLRGKTMHALEHFLATYLRAMDIGVLYVGGMGCLTGFYVLVDGERSPRDILMPLIRAFTGITLANVIPSATKKECGNCTFMDLEDAKREARNYLDLLLTLAKCEG